MKGEALEARPPRDPKRTMQDTLPNPVPATSMRALTSHQSPRKIDLARFSRIFRAKKKKNWGKPGLNW